MPGFFLVIVKSNTYSMPNIWKSQKSIKKKITSNSIPKR